MNTLEAITSRRSIRKYKDDPVPADLAAEIAEAGSFAPSGNGAQSTIILVVTDKSVRDKLSKLNATVLGSDDDPFYGAPAVLVVLANKESSTYVYDGALTMGTLMLAAKEHGLGSCWVHRAKQQFECDEGKALLKDLGIPEGFEGIGNCIIGYADEQPEPAKRNDGRIVLV